MGYKTEIQLRIIFSSPIWFVRIFLKSLMLRYNIRNISFCKHCGVDVRDFLVTDELWKKAFVKTNSNVLCYNCFQDLCTLNNIKVDVGIISEELI